MLFGPIVSYLKMKFPSSLLYVAINISAYNAYEGISLLLQLHLDSFLYHSLYAFHHVGVFATLSTMAHLIVVSCYIFQGIVPTQKSHQHF